MRQTVQQTFGELPRREQHHLCIAAARSFAVADTTAVVLGLDLWRDEIERWRDLFSCEAERPSMWRFAFGPSASWETRLWRSLPLEVRVLRAHVGSLAHEIAADGIMRSGIKLAKDDGRLETLRQVGLVDGSGSRVRFRPLASPEVLAVDLALVVIVTHWLGSCAVADWIASDRSTREVEICGYRDACRFCRSRWGTHLKERWSLPPFHPACRCFAQPAYRKAK